MCGADGNAEPVCRTVSPSAKEAAHNSNPETNCDEAEASISTVPPGTAPVPRTRNGRPEPSIRTPNPRSASSSGAMGRALACSSPSNSTIDSASAASGTNHSTVPARPQSTCAIGSGTTRPLTVNSVPSPSTRRPSVRSAPIIKSVSRLRSAPLMVGVPWPCAAASAASTRVRLVCDFEPGTVTVACTGCGARGPST